MTMHALIEQAKRHLDPSDALYLVQNQAIAVIGPDDNEWRGRVMMVTELPTSELQDLLARRPNDAAVRLAVRTLLEMT